MPARIIEASRVHEAAALLRAGKLVAFPTDTVYGIAAKVDGDSLEANPDSAALRAFKGGRAEPFSLHCGNVDQALAFLPQANAADIFAFRQLAPRGVTPVIRWHDRSLGVRVVQHVLGSSLLVGAGVPVLASSANLHGQPTLRDASSIAALPGIDAVLDGGELPQRPASTVARLLPSGMQVLRAGALAGAELARVFTRSVRFVCMGNLNRSAFAHKLIEAMQAWLSANVPGFVPAWHSASAGIIANPSQRVPEPMVTAAAARGVALAAHKPSRFGVGVDDAMLVALGDDVAAAVEAVAHREVLNMRIADPMGGPAEGYAAAAAAIARGLRHAMLSEWAPLGVDDTRLESDFEKLFLRP